eukprot:TRINITY_DN88081_c0_g1_i1.p1 TRINITY_DN88081_c0_g1~~TRINITY_DN88081_c0_g1_i1.p1  ORF type:complete len:134 (+),score=15.41 TRINITY_DN88081_c0_g1_i1:2-403(+)
MDQGNLGDVFFHLSTVANQKEYGGSILPGMCMKCTVVPTDKGPKAHLVSIKEKMNTVKGTIKMCNYEKGFGFVQTEEADVYFRCEVVRPKKGCVIGDSVTCAVVSLERGPQAIKVQVHSKDEELPDMKKKEGA